MILTLYINSLDMTLASKPFNIFCITTLIYHLGGSILIKMDVMNFEYCVTFVWVRHTKCTYFQNVSLIGDYHWPGHTNTSMVCWALGTVMYHKHPQALLRTLVRTVSISLVAYFMNPFFTCVHIPDEWSLTNRSSTLTLFTVATPHNKICLKQFYPQFRL